jgi:phospholipid/cholesterol/gamma-HCH transport system substrate-binding protein
VETKEVAQQVKLGAFVLGGLILFLATVFLIGSENNIFSRTFSIAAEFKNVEGLKEGDNVWLSGVKIGTVTDLKIVSEGKVVVKLTLKNKQNEFIRKDASASIGSDGLVGNKIVVIKPGASKEPITANDTINASNPASTEELMNIAKDVGQNARALTHDLSVIAERISKGQGLVGEVFNDGDLAKELRAAVASLKHTGENSANATRELHTLLYEMHHGTGLLPMLISDTAYAQTFRGALANIEQVSANAEVVSKHLQSLASKMDDQNNALGTLLSDEHVAAQLRSTISNAESATQKLDDNMAALQHNFLLRGYFKKQERKKEKEAASSKGN